MSLDLYINSWGSSDDPDGDGDGPWEQVIRFTDSEDYSEWWQGIWIHKRNDKGVVRVSSGPRAGEIDRSEAFEFFQLKRWYKVELIQFEERDLVN